MIWQRLSMIVFFVVLGWMWFQFDYCAGTAFYILAGVLVYAQLRDIDFGKPSYLLLVMAPLGAIILAFQQSELHDAICTVAR